MTPRRIPFVIWPMLAIAAYFCIAQWTFAFRHPWATDTERFIHIPEALLFRSVPYKVMRPRE